MHSKTPALSAADLADDFDVRGERFPTDRELAQDRKAQEEEAAKRAWMADTARQLAGRIPTSVFALGDLAVSR